MRRVEAIARTLPVGSVGYEAERAASGGYFISLEKTAADKLRSQLVLSI